MKMLVVMAAIFMLAGCNDTTRPTKVGEEDVDTLTEMKESPSADLPDKSDTVAVQKQRDEALERLEHDGMNKSQAGHNNPGRKVVYLTFDDGPSANTPQILDILHEYDVKATFFVVGRSTKWLHCIKRAHDEGHAIAAHTYSHDFSIYRSQQAYFDDLERIEQVIESQIGKRTNIIRFPGGSSNLAYFHHSQDSTFMIRLAQTVLDRGYQYVDWNISSEDATANVVPTSVIISHACSTKYNDVCVLMHDASAKVTTVKALPSIIEFYKNNGYEFGTITDTSYLCHHGIHPYRPKDAKPKKKAVDSLVVHHRTKKCSTPVVKEKEPVPAVDATMSATPSA